MMPASLHLTLIAALLAVSLDSLVTHVPADSLARVLRRTEQAASGHRAGEAAMMLGRLHYARGEYRAAADAYARAAARLEPSSKPEAHYGAGLAWLALHSPNPARAAFEAVTASGSPRRAEAMLGIAMAWELADRPDRAYETLEKLLAGDPGESGAPALERYATLAERFQRPHEAARARARLLGQYPESMEAAAAALAMNTAIPATGTTGSITVEAGRFSTEARARSLMSRAAKAGFPEARVVPRGAGSSRTFSVMLGAYTAEADARSARERAARMLGVTARITGRP